MTSKTRNTMHRPDPAKPGPRSARAPPSFQRGPCPSFPTSVLSPDGRRLRDSSAHRGTRACLGLQGDAQHLGSLPSRAFPPTAFRAGYPSPRALPSLGRVLNGVSHRRQTSPDTGRSCEQASWVGQGAGSHRRAAFQNPPSQHIPDDHVGSPLGLQPPNPPSR